MKQKWLWIGLAAGSAITLFFILMIGVAALFSGERNAFKGDGVGLVEVKGVIIDSQETVKQLHSLKKDRHVKAVVVRLDSPGGVVGPSQ